uniref:Endonuclease/exonuclease/phosphatase domain-containing protein n=1 Tax=Poecilia latipinna TaxID=48699 RepID=A0A3B3U0J3_9TELE
PRTLKIVDYIESDPDLDLTKIIQTRKRLASLWDISQEKEMSHKWKGKMFSSTSSTQAGGVAIFMREGLFNNCHLIHKDQQGKFIIIDFFYNNKSCRLINIHAPNIDTHRKRFFIGLRQWIVTNCIIIGDFNITLTKSDISNNCTFSEDYSRNTLFDIITQNSLRFVHMFFFYFVLS